MSDLEGQVRNFALEAGTTITESVYVDARLDVELVRGGDAFFMNLVRGDGSSGPVPLLKPDGLEPAAIQISFNLTLDRQRSYLKVRSSKFALYSVLDRQPLFRLEYISDPVRVPICHWQVHAERGALTHLLTRSGRRMPHSLASLHLPVGGERFRPGLEDFLQFAIEGCGVSAKPGYSEVLRRGRESWRTRQLASAIRDQPTLAAAALRDMGYDVTAPASTPEANATSFSRW